MKHMAYTDSQGKCRKLACPFGSGPFNGQCKPLTNHMNNLGVRILLDLHFVRKPSNDSNQNQTAMLPLENGENIYTSVFEALNVKSCTFCKIYFWKYKNMNVTLHHSDGVFDLTVSTNDNCQYEDLHCNIDQAIETKIHISLKDSKLVSVYLQYTKRPFGFSIRKTKIVPNARLTIRKVLSKNQLDVF